MANKAISALSAATTPDGTEVLPIVQGGATVKATARQVAVGGVAGQDIAPASVTTGTVNIGSTFPISATDNGEANLRLTRRGVTLLDVYDTPTWGFGAVSFPNAATLSFGNLSLYAPDANTLALRNGTNAQTLLISRNFSDASNFSQLKIAAAGSAVTFSVNELGSGIGTLTSFVFADAPTTIIPPTSDPHVVGALWNDAGTLTISAG